MNYKIFKIDIMSSKYSQEQIQEEEEVQATQPQKENPNQAEEKEQKAEQQKKEKSQKSLSVDEQIKKQSIEKQQEKPQSIQGEKMAQQVTTSPIKHQEIGKYASTTMQMQEEKQSQIKLKIVGVETRGSALSKYTIYVIKGYDSNGEISKARRFSQFHAMRVALCKRWPGCFIPSIPEKNYMEKNDKDLVTKRQRYLNDFLYKMTKLPHLYASQQFQALLRSTNEDISNTFSSWSAPTYESIINKYRQCFSDLAGKQIDNNSNDTIARFYAAVRKDQSLVSKYRYHARNLAVSKDKYNQSFPKIFSKLIPAYEQTLLFEYTGGKEEHLVFLNSEQAKMAQQSSIVDEISNKNPFWLIYDMLKHQQRDAKAFMEMIDSRQALETKKHSLETKIIQNQKNISEISEGKKNIKSMTSKSSNDQLKYKIQVQNEQLKKEKTFLTNLLDIITALIVYIEIPSYKEEKIKFYQNVLKRIGGFEINSIQICGQVWQNTLSSSTKISKIAA